MKSQIYFNTCYIRRGGGLKPDVGGPINGAAYKWGDYDRKFTVYKIQLRPTNEAGSYRHTRE